MSDRVRDVSAVLAAIVMVCALAPTTHAHGYHDAAVVFANTEHSSLRGNRPTGQGAVSSSAVGAVNLGSDSGGTEPGATANYSTVVGGDGNSAMGIYATAGGRMSVASGRSSLAIGEAVTAQGYGSHAEGISTNALNEGAHAEGWNTYAWPRYSHVEGSSCAAGLTASDLQSLGAHAEGAGTIAGGGIGPHSEGYGAEARSQASHAEGAFTRATMPAAHAEGEDTQANAWRSHTEGAWTEARGTAGHAQGMATLAQGDRSFAAGDSSIALRETQFAFAGGNFLNDSSSSILPPPARSHAQTSLLVLRAQTLGVAVGETTEFLFGTNRNQRLVLEDGKAYELLTSAVLAGVIGGVRVSQLVAAHALAQCVGGVASVAVFDTSTYGYDGWSVQVTTTVNRLEWRVSTGDDTAKVNGLLRVDFSEVVFPD